MDTIVSNPERPRKRRRAALACEECRRKKIKCDREFPCIHCKQGNHECFYISGPPSTTSSRTSLSNQAGQRPQVVSQNNTFPGYSLASPVSTPRSVARVKTPQSIQSHDDQETIIDLRRQIRSLEQKLTDSQKQTQGKNTEPAQLQPKSVQSIASKDRIFGPSHWLSACQQFDKIRSLIYGIQNDTSALESTRHGAETISILKKCKHIAQVLKRSQRAPGPISISDVIGTLPARDIADQLVELYLHNFESVWRILHIPSWLKEYNHYWENPAESSYEFLAKFMLVMAVGLCFYKDPHEAERLRFLAVRWILAVHYWTSSPYEKGFMTLSRLQTLCLLVTARQTHSVSAQTAWISTGSLLRMAIFMGLHRDPKHLPRMNNLQIELRRRLWATILEMTVQLSLDAGQAPYISFDDFDTEPPSNIDDDEIDETKKIPPQAKPLTTFTQTSIQLLLYSSLQTRLEVVRLANSLVHEPSYDTILALSKRTVTELRSGSQQIQSYSNDNNNNNNNNNSQPTPFHRNLFESFQRHFLSILHRSFANKARIDPRYLFSRKVCLENALSAVSWEPDEDFALLLRLSGGTFREVLIRSAMTICLEMITQLEEEADHEGLTGSSLGFGSNNNDPHVENPTQLLHQAHKRALYKWRDLTEARIKNGDLNVKVMIFISMVMAQIEAIEARLSEREMENKIFEAARSTAQHCYGLVRDYAERVLGRDVESSVDGVGNGAGNHGPGDGGGAGVGGNSMAVGGGLGDVFDGIDLDAVLQDGDGDFEMPFSWLWPVN